MPLLIILMAVLLAACASKPAPAPTPVQTATAKAVLTWDRHATAELFVIYACWTKECPVPNKKIASVRQPVTGEPHYTVYLHGRAGALAVTAWDGETNESGLSNVVRFDRR